MRKARSGMKSKVLVRDSRNNWSNKCEPFTVREGFTYLRPDGGNLKSILVGNEGDRTLPQLGLTSVGENSGGNGLMTVEPTFRDRGNAGI